MACATSPIAAGSGGGPSADRTAVKDIGHASRHGAGSEPHRFARPQHVGLEANIHAVLRPAKGRAQAPASPAGSDRAADAGNRKFEFRRRQRNRTAPGASGDAMHMAVDARGELAGGKTGPVLSV
jgi:hypothetical protein